MDLAAVPFQRAVRRVGDGACGALESRLGCGGHRANGRRLHTGHFSVRFRRHPSCFARPLHLLLLFFLRRFVLCALWGLLWGLLRGFALRWFAFVVSPVVMLFLHVLPDPMLYKDMPRIKCLYLTLLLVFFLFATFLAPERVPPYQITDVVLSSFNCTQTENLDRQCIFKDVYVVDKTLWIVSPTPLDVPQVLCSAVDGPGSHKCSIEWHTPKELITRLKSTHAKVEFYTTGILFSRLAPENPYHTLFEEYLPIYEIIASVSELAHWLKPSSAKSKLLVLQDRFTPDKKHPDYSFLFPDVQRIVQNDPKVAFRVNFLVAGTKASCVHPAHCSRGKFLTPDVGTHFRRHALRLLGLPTDRPTAAPRVTIVQRPAIRMITNVDELLSKVNGVLATLSTGTPVQNATVVDFSQLPVVRQVEIAANTDILILVHGGALGNVMFLPPHAVVIDIYPYAFFAELHGYIMNGIRIAMPSMHYGHRRVETNDSSTVVLQDGLCMTPRCNAIMTVLPFIMTRCIYVDVELFKTHFEEVLQAWCNVPWSINLQVQAKCPGSSGAAQEVYAPPPSMAEFTENTKTVAKRNLGGVSCDHHVKCGTAVRQRFLSHHQCKMQ
eukprot:GGOE01053513.1.p1 GENE.GGOE01053513.1~~GGOE01053513.1.p1  ORF type:complete len:608 (+),score=47.05 GGOE01053513.1:432-2255(+)